MENKLSAMKTAINNPNYLQRFADHEVKNKQGVFDYNKCKRVIDSRIRENEATEMIADYKSMIEFTDDSELKQYYLDEIEKLEKLI